MKKIALASACFVTLSTGAFAQTQPAPGASSQGNVGPGAVQDARKDEMKKGSVTTGAGRAEKHMGSSSAPSSSGNVGPGTNNNSGPQPGGR